MKVTDFFLDGQTLMLFRAGHRKVLPTLNSDMLFCKNYYLVKKTMSDFFKEKKRTDFLRKKATERSELSGHDVGKKLVALVAAVSGFRLNCVLTFLFHHLLLLLRLQFLCLFFF